MYLQLDLGLCRALVQNMIEKFEVLMWQKTEVMGIELIILKHIPMKFESLYTKNLQLTSISFACKKRETPFLVFL